MPDTERLLREARGARLIVEERQRQIEGEGWNARHDDTHDSGELARPPGWCPVTLAEALSRYQKQHRPTGYSTAHLVVPSAEGWRAPVDRKVIAERARQSLARLGAALAGDGGGA